MNEAIELLQKIIDFSREDVEGDCIFCGCELGQGDDETETCYEGCLMVQARALVRAAGQGESGGQNRAADTSSP